MEPIKLIPGLNNRSHMQALLDTIAWHNEQIFKYELTCTREKMSLQNMAEEDKIEYEKRYGKFENYYIRFENYFDELIENHKKQIFIIEMDTSL